MTLRSLLGTALALVVGCRTEVATTPPEPLVVTEPLEVGRTFTGWFYTGRTSSIWARMSTEMREVFGSASRLADFREEVMRGAGEERAINTERVVNALGAHVYNRIATFSKGG